MPEDPEGAIFAYNHADWYVADVLARAACYGGITGGALSLLPERQLLSCGPKGDSLPVPKGYLNAFETAAGATTWVRRASGRWRRLPGWSPISAAAWPRPS